MNNLNYWHSNCQIGLYSTLPDKEQFKILNIQAELLSVALLFLYKQKQKLGLK
jgi:hypothetical protein